MFKNVKIKKKRIIEKSKIIIKLLLFFLNIEINHTIK